MHEYMLVDHITGQFLERCSEHAEAKSRKGVLQASRRRRVAIHKVRLPDRPIPKQLARQRNRTLQTHARLALSSQLAISRKPEASSALSLSRLWDVSSIASNSAHGNWEEYRNLRRRYRATPSDDGGAPYIACDSTEIAVVRILAQTYPYNQFGVTPTGDVFAGYSFGYHTDPARLYVTTLCPILGEAAELLLHRSIGEGGRFYVHPEVIERAADQTLLARLEISKDTMPG